VTGIIPEPIRSRPRFSDAEKRKQEIERKKLQRKAKQGSASFYNRISWRANAKYALSGLIAILAFVIVLILLFSFFPLNRNWL
jgi:hypothetical protein